MPGLRGGARLILCLVTLAAAPPPVPPSWAGGPCDGTIRVPQRRALDRERELERVFAHEFVHAIVASTTTRRLPKWFEERSGPPPFARRMQRTLEEFETGWNAR